MYTETQHVSLNNENTDDRIVTYLQYAQKRILCMNVKNFKRRVINMFECDNPEVNGAMDDSKDSEPSVAHSVCRRFVCDNPEVNAFRTQCCS